MLPYARATSRCNLYGKGREIQKSFASIVTILTKNFPIFLPAWPIKPMALKLKARTDPGYYDQPIIMLSAPGVLPTNFSTSRPVSDKVLRTGSVASFGEIFESHRVSVASSSRLRSQENHFTLLKPV